MPIGFQIQRHVGDEIRTNRRNRRIFCHSAVILVSPTAKTISSSSSFSSGFEKLFASDRVVDVCLVDCLRRYCRYYYYYYCFLSRAASSSLFPIPRDVLSTLSDIRPRFDRALINSPCFGPLELPSTRCIFPQIREVSRAFSFPRRHSRAVGVLSSSLSVFVFVFVFFSGFPELDVPPSWSLSAARIKTKWCNHIRFRGLATNIENDADDAGRRRRRRRRMRARGIKHRRRTTREGGKRAWFYLSLSPRKGEIMCGQKGRSLWKYL